MPMPLLHDVPLGWLLVWQLPDVHVELLQVPLGGHAPHAPPALPQALSDVPAWQLLPSQQPVQQLPP